MTRMIDVTGAYVVGVGEELQINHEPAFRLMAGDSPPELICKGSVVARGAAENMYGVITDSHALDVVGARVALYETASFTVRSEQQGATGFSLLMSEASFLNAGEVKVNGGAFALGLTIEGEHETAVNSGRLEVTSRNAATGVSLGGSSHLTNSGEIVVSDGTFGANGVIMSPDGDFENSGLLQVDAEIGAFGVQMSVAGRVENGGQILASSRNGDATGVSFWDNGQLHNTGLVAVKAFGPATGVALNGSGKVVNDGTIAAASSGSDARSVGVWGGDSSLQIVNSGLIRADDAILIQDSLTGMTVDNTGKLQGDVTLSGGDDRLGNLGGVIRGHVLLGAGDDNYAGGAGKLFGDVSGGDGDDLLVLGKTDDHIAGGAGADTLTGGAGSDVFVYTAVSDSAGGKADLIVDLDVHGGGDLIDLSAIDADSVAGGDQAFHLVAALSGEAGELAVVHDVKHGLTLVLGDADGDGKADLRIVLQGDHSGFDGFAL